MDMGQGVRRAGIALRKTGTWLTERVKWRQDGTGIRRTGKMVLAGVAILVVYYIGGAWIMYRIDANMDFRPRQEAQGGQSAAVAMAVALIERETREEGWTANDPFYKPTTLLDNTPNFQQGLIASLARFSFELTDQLGRTRGSSQADPDLQAAAGFLQTAGDIWVWNPSLSLLPMTPSEREYTNAAESLREYNNRLASGNAVFERRSDNLLATLDRIALDIGSSSAVIDQHVSENSGFPIHRKVDDVFYTVKGQMYGYYMILNALGDDFEAIIAERNLQKPYKEMLRSLELGVAQQPIVVINGSPDSQIIPCHLCGQGFYLLRARTQLREITNILLK